MLLATHYRSPIDFSDERIEEVGRSLDGFYRLIETFGRITNQNFYDLPTAASRGETRTLEGDPPGFFAELTSLRDRFIDCMDDEVRECERVGQCLRAKMSSGLCKSCHWSLPLMEISCRLRPSCEPGDASGPRRLAQRVALFGGGVDGGGGGSP